MTLRADTWVTNHDYRDGRAIPIQAVLQAGTAVLVDAYGTPRVKCYCGNPLLPPNRRPPTYGGTPWTGFDPGEVVVINNNTTIIDIFVLTNIEDGDLITRPGGTDGARTHRAGRRPVRRARPGPTGHTNVVTGPTGPPDRRHRSDRRHARHRRRPGDAAVARRCRPRPARDRPRGHRALLRRPLVHRAAARSTTTTEPAATAGGSHAENVFWPTGGAPTGSYPVYVVNYSGCSDPPAYPVEIKVNGVTAQTLSGTLGERRVFRDHLVPGLARPGELTGVDRFRCTTPSAGCRSSRRSSRASTTASSKTRCCGRSIPRTSSPHAGT